jgi:hypothetical protein
MASVGWHCGCSRHAAERACRCDRTCRYRAPCDAAAGPSGALATGIRWPRRAWSR